jgi:NAD dependent epimerase/dehydratase
MKVLVTGSSGFIGSHLVQTLVEAGHQVRALVHYNGAGRRGHLDDLSADHLKSVEIVHGDVTDNAQMHSLVSGCDAVCHLAALIGIPYSYEAPYSYNSTNVGGTLNMLEACRRVGIGRLIITSTSEVYGTAQYSPIDELHPLQGQSPYSASKIGADKFAESYFRSFDLPVVTLRPFNTYGPRQSARAIIPTVLTQALSGASEIRLGNLTPMRDLTFVKDTARAFCLALTAPGIEGETIHFGNGDAISIGDLAKLCLDVTGSKASIVTDAERHRPDKSEVGLLLCNPDKAAAKIGWQPSVTLREGLAQTTDWLVSRLHHYRPGEYAV